MSKTDNRGVKIYLDTTDYKKGIDQIVKETQEYNKQLEELKRTGQGTSEAAEDLRKKIEALKEQEKKYTSELKQTERILKNLSGATYTELIAVKRKLTDQLKIEQRGTEKHKVILEQYKRVCEELTNVQKEMRVEVGCQGTTFGRAANFINKYAGLITTSVAGVTGLTMTIRKAVNDYAQMAEAEAQVMKYTGMTKEEVADLNEEFKKMDTRTSREQLNGLSGDAGRLGITGKEDILDFVDAADKINVALGEDLGEDAVANIGKLAQMFGEDERMGLRGAMLATGSAINEVAQNSSAAEPFLVDFTARVAGAAQQAGISQASIIGFAASMDENMLRNETSATAYQKILTKMFSDTEKFAKVAGLNVQDFTELLRTDANEALLTFAEALGKKGGLADLAPIFGDLQTEGAGVSTVLSVMAGKADEIRQRQALANQAYQEGTSILKEYEVQNNTVQAGLDKAKKGFLDVSIQLGEKLLPLMSSMVSGAGLLVRVLNAVIGICFKYSGTVITLGASVTAYTLILESEVLWSKAVALWNGRVMTSFQKLYAALAKHPYGMLFVAFATLVAYLRDAKIKQDELKKSMQGMNKVNAEVSKSIAAEEGKIKALTSVIDNNKASLDKRREALNELKKIVPGYNAMLTDEGTLTNNNTEAIKNYLVQLEKEIKLKAAREELEGLYRKQREKERQLVTEEETLKEAGISLSNARFAATQRAGQASTSGTRMLTGGLDQGVKNMESNFNNATKAVQSTKQELSEISVLIEQINKEIAATSLTVVDNNPIGGGGGGTPATDTPTTDPLKAKQEAVKQAIAAENALYEQQRADLKRTYIEGLDENLNSYALYSEAQEQLEMAHLHRTLEIAGLDADARRKIEEQLLDFKLKCMKEAENEQTKSSKKQTTQSKKATEEIKRQYESQFTTIKGYADQFGSALGEVIIGQTSALEALGGVMIDVVFDVLDQTINAWLTRLAAAAAVATAEGSMKEIGSKGLLGIATSAAIAAAVSGLLATAKSALKGLLGKGRKGKSSSASADVSSSAAPTGSRIPTGSVAQHASGRYDVIGAEDKRTYRNVPYIGESPTGIVRSPALISENGAELIVNAEDLRRLQQHINYPLVMQAISDSHRGTAVPQYAAGTAQRIVEGITSVGESVQQAAITPDLIVRLTNAIASLEANGVDAFVSLSELEKKQKLLNQSRKIGSK